jgi:hypothetical protein
MDMREQVLSDLKHAIEDELGVTIEHWYEHFESQCQGNIQSEECLPVRFQVVGRNKVYCKLREIR